jgi:cell division protein FtsB
MLSASAADVLSRLRRQGLTVALAALIVLLQYPLWFGEGGWLKVREGAQKIEAQEKLNQRLRVRNATLLAEVSDLKQGRESIEEKARSELGMVAPDEWFVRVIPAHTVGKK